MSLQSIKSLKDGNALWAMMGFVNPIYVMPSFNDPCAAPRIHAWWSVLDVSLWVSDSENR